MQPAVLAPADDACSPGLLARHVPSVVVQGGVVGRQPGESCLRGAVQNLERLKRGTTILLRTQGETERDRPGRARDSRPRNRCTRVRGPTRPRTTTGSRAAGHRAARRLSAASPGSCCTRRRSEARGPAAPSTAVSSGPGTAASGRRPGNRQQGGHPRARRCCSARRSDAAVARTATSARAPT